MKSCHKCEADGKDSTFTEDGFTLDTTNLHIVLCAEHWEEFCMVAPSDIVEIMFKALDHPQQ